MSIQLCLSTIIKEQLLNFSPLSKDNFIVDLKRNSQDCVYKTNFCLQLTKITNQSPSFIAENVVNYYARSNFKEEFLVEISKENWLEIIISNNLLNQWLNNIQKSQISFNIEQKIKESQVNFTNIYYTHARCCSLLKSAHRQNIITLNQLDLTMNQWKIQYPQFINYIPLLTLKSYEQKLVKELLIINEKIHNHKVNDITILNNLSQRILDVECHGRIWGETLSSNFSLSQARLGLIAISLHYFQNIYYAKFKEYLPQEIST